MRTEISEIELNNEWDLVLAHRRTIQICKFAGLSIADQTRFATAVSEIGRNCLLHCGSGKITFTIVKTNDTFKFETIIADEGPGISNLEDILTRDPQTHKGRGIGIVFAKKLADVFWINSTTKGTSVTLEKFIPSSGNPINDLILKGWIKHLKNEPDVSPYEELKTKNQQLMQLTEELRAEKLKVDEQVNQIRKLNAQLESSNTYMKQFTYAVSHDLKTPLSNLQISLMLLEENPDTEERKKFINIAIRAEKNLRKVIMSLLEILELQDSGLQIASVISFEEITDEIVEQLSRHYSVEDIDLKKDFENGREINYIPAYITSILYNLLSNSIKYRSPNRRLQITIKTQKIGKQTLLHFSDNGQGIDMGKFRSKLFKPFSRFSDKPDGKGIGLFIIKSMIEKNGGSIMVESELGKGTAFQFYLNEYDI